MDKLQTQKSLILKNGFDQLIEGGLRSFTVENLAACLCMSKKTIYKFFPTKEALIDKIISRRLELIETEIQNVMISVANPIEKFMGVMEVFYHSISKIKIERLSELKNRYPVMWQRIEDFRLNRREDFYTILKSAQEQGLIKPNIDIDLISTVYTHIINSTFQPEFFIQNALTPQSVVPAYVDMVTGGLLSESGHHFYKRLKDSTE